MRTRSITVLLIALASAALLAACGGDDDGGPTASAPERTGTTEAPLAKTPPLIGGFYEGRGVNYLLTDVSTEKDAKGLSDATNYPVSFVASLGQVPDGSTAKLYLFMNGVAGPNPFGFQPNVIDSVPGDPGYSPLWRVYAVTWKDEPNARELRSEDQILAAEQAGEVTVEKTPLVKNSPVVAGR